MAKGKRELIIEVSGDQLQLVEFKKLLETELKTAGFKFTEDVKMYFNVSEQAVYCVSAATGKQLKIEF